MQDRLGQAVEALKAAKAQGLSYYDATQNLTKQGFTPEEVEQASYQFPYSDAEQTDSNAYSGSNPSMNQAFAEAVVHDEAVDNAKQELHKDAALGILGGKGLVGGYYGNKAVGDYAALKDLEKNGQTAPIKQNVVHESNGRVFTRNRAIRYYAFLSLVPLVLLAPYCIGLFSNLPSIATALTHHHDAASLGSIGLYLWSAAGYMMYICIALLLFLAHRESTIIKTIYIIMGIDFALFVLFAIIFKSPEFLVFGLITLVPSYWISKRVGLLLQPR
jgi:hypothetical protein